MVAATARTKCDSEFSVVIGSHSLRPGSAPRSSGRAPAGLAGWLAWGVGPALELLNETGESKRKQHRTATVAGKCPLLTWRYGLCHHARLVARTYTLTLRQRCTCGNVTKTWAAREKEVKRKRGNAELRGSALEGEEPERKVLLNAVKWQTSPWVRVAV